jgi:putative oxidoreductase
MSPLQKAFDSSAPRAAVFIRAAVGVIFASEGIQKFLYADAQGAGRFARIGIPAPEVMGPFVGVVEILPILLGEGYWIFNHTFAPKSGFWSFLHESRTDLSMLLGSIFLLLVGAGPWSVDAIIQHRIAGPRSEARR